MRPHQSLDPFPDKSCSHQPMPPPRKEYLTLRDRGTNPSPFPFCRLVRKRQNGMSYFSSPSRGSPWSLNDHCGPHLPPCDSRVTPTRGRVWEMCAHPQQIPVCSHQKNHMEELKPATSAPTLRGQNHMRTFLQPCFTCPNVEEVQVWVSVQWRSAGCGWHPKGWFC